MVPEQGPDAPVPARPTPPATPLAPATPPGRGLGTFDELIAEAEAVPVDGWDFSWLDGRATEERPAWGYARSMGERMARATAALDLQTGGGETLAAVPRRPPLTVATESWPPHVARATALLHPLGAAVVAVPDESALPFADGAFDLVVSRHPVTVRWAEITRVLRPGGTYFSQEVGPASVFELVEFFLGPRSEEERSGRDPDRAARAAASAGLRVVDLRTAALRTEFHDIGAVVYFLRKVIWMVPDFTVERYRGRLAELHRRIEADGPFVATTTRFLIEAVKPEPADLPDPVDLPGPSDLP
ncbi:class I SAM-dependent methyltransferase [Streptomyces corynorhini]|uniref:Class I SAM-dependent methyltransferase n=1 Tax=Streptomyces corynorhini TaxID=2282652 RepID=A0A370BKJ8_9ACTN|nr:class I SAM-dependent methyltransferase [Streptomyces corynorhini]RDG40126.1 class I SAM-dependent methyltransferase [Streptomyces corynorhini]